VKRPKAEGARAGALEPAPAPERGRPQGASPASQPERPKAEEARTDEPAAGGATREDLARRVPRCEGLCPEQIIGRPPAGVGRGGAAVVDQWGRAHALQPTTSIGRDPEHATLAVLEASVSRLHAELAHDARARRWRVRDLGSTNGTFVDGQRLTGPVVLAGGELVGVGDVAFLFLPDPTFFAVQVTDSIRATSLTRGAEGMLRLVGAAAGGVGVVEHNGVQVQLGSAQYALVHLLAERLLAERDQPADVRGFVRSVELLANLPWDTAHPEDNHVKQLVRRVRRALERAGLAEAIESRHGLGYRLTVEPVLRDGDA
jgi:hypothetical protein